MKITAKVTFSLFYYLPGEKIGLLLNTPKQVLEKIQKLENANIPISSEIIVTTQISNCTFKKIFCIRRYHSRRYDDFKNFRHAFNI
jgi:hypothetical protein